MPQHLRAHRSQAFFPRRFTVRPPPHRQIPTHQRQAIVRHHNHLHAIHFHLCPLFKLRCGGPLRQRRMIRISFRKFHHPRLDRFARRHHRRIDRRIRLRRSSPRILAKRVRLHQQIRRPLRLQILLRHRLDLRNGDLFHLVHLRVHPVRIAAKHRLIPHLRSQLFRRLPPVSQDDAPMHFHLFQLLFRHALLAHLGDCGHYHLPHLIGILTLHHPRIDHENPGIFHRHVAHTHPCTQRLLAADQQPIQPTRTPSA